MSRANLKLSGVERFPSKIGGDSHTRATLHLSCEGDPESNGRIYEADIQLVIADVTGSPERFSLRFYDPGVAPGATFDEALATLARYARRLAWGLTEIERSRKAEETVMLPVRLTTGWMPGTDGAAVSETETPDQDTEAPDAGEGVERG